MRNNYPARIGHVVQRFEFVVGRWAQASGCSVEDVKQEIALSVVAGENPAAAVPRRLGIRKLPGAGWMSTDLTVCAAVNDCIFDSERHDIALQVEQEEREENGIGGTDQIAHRHKISRRAAQLRCKNQRRRFDENGDLFEGGV